MNETIIENLQDSYSRALLIPVIGSGLSVPFGLPDWKTLIKTIAERNTLPENELLKIKELLDANELLEAIDAIMDSGVSEETLQNGVVEIMTAAKKNAGTAESNYTDLARMPRLRFMTTNYDEYLNDILGARTFLLRDLHSMNVNEFALRRYDNTVIPIHGEISKPDSIVFTKQSYERLYNSDEFEREFQHIRTHFIFLFMGFSFDDPYFQRLFEKVANRFEARHYILFEKGEKIKNAEKISMLREEYGVNSLFFDASDTGYTEAIRSFLEQIFMLRDMAVDMSCFERLPEHPQKEMTEAERKIVAEGIKAIEEERVSDVHRIYSEQYHDERFYGHSPDFQCEVICGLSWYYGYMKRNEPNEQLFEKELGNPVIQEKKERLIFMYGQALWNLREYDKCMELLAPYTGREDMLNSLLFDIVADYKRFLPDRGQRAGMLPVYGKKDRSDEEKRELRAAYTELKKKYINEETYNLLSLKKYGNADDQKTAYYFLGIAAGQLFHEHREAVEYLNRAYELDPSMSVCEELAQNYLAAAEEGIRYNQYARVYQVDMNSLMKAKIRFQYVMNWEDEEARKSFYEGSGCSYLRTLFLLRDYYAFEEFYQTACEYIPEDYALILMKAEVDAHYEQRVDPEMEKKLTREDHLFIRFLCATRRAGYFDTKNPATGVRIRNSLLEQFDSLSHPVSDIRLFRIVLDEVVLNGNRAYYEKMLTLYPPEYFSDVRTLGFEDELYGRLDEAEARFEAAFAVHKDYLGTFQMVRHFYIRNKMKKEYDRLYENVLRDPPDSMYETPGFFAEYIMTEAAAWDDRWNAFRLYDRYSGKIGSDPVWQRRLEEELKKLAGDYGDYADRIEWNRYMLRKAPGGERTELYLSILKLYVANMKYKEAEAVLDEMKRAHIPSEEGFDRLIAVCRRRQKKEYYIGAAKPLRSDKHWLEGVDREVNRGRFALPYFGCKGYPVLLSIKQIICLYRHNRQRELEEFPEVYIAYGGIINLQNSLWTAEDPFLRMILQGLQSLDHIIPIAPDFMNVCSYMAEYTGKIRDLEVLQLKLFAAQNPEVIRV